MRRKLLAALMFGTVIAGTIAYVENVQATPSFGFTGTPLAVGRFGDIDVSNHVFFPDADGNPGHTQLWLSHQKSKGPSDLHVQSNTWIPGGTTGWHTHPGHSLIIVTSGAVTVYDGHDASCTPRVYTQGMGFVDEGGDHVHVIRNEGTVEAKTVAVQLIPAGAARRADASGNPACAF